MGDLNGGSWPSFGALIGDDLPTLIVDKGGYIVAMPHEDFQAQLDRIEAQLDLIVRLLRREAM